MNDHRPDPDKLLASIQKTESQKNKGKLRIFLGMCPGVGKTYAMLQAAKERQTEGIDVLVAIVETHNRKETGALLSGLKILPKIKISYRDIALEEMNLDGVLHCNPRPELVLVDELAHTNVPGSRHPKRYQDVIELLDAGIDVYTTLNVQHIESRAETVYQITGVQIQETIPDSLLDQADEITLIDISPDQLRQRLTEGKVYLGERAATAANNFFREGNLTALREIALRHTAEHVNQNLRDIMTQESIAGPWKTSERLMVAVGPTPFSESLIRWTRRGAASLKAPWVAVYVETQQILDEKEQNRLNSNLALARKLGAEVIVRSGNDVAGTLLEVARQNNVTQICIGKPAGFGLKELLFGGSFIQRLIRESGDIDIHMVRVRGLNIDKIKPVKKPLHFSSAGQYGLSLAIVCGVTFLCLILEKISGYSSIALIYLLAVVFSGIFLERGPVLLLAFLSSLLWNFLFIPPRFTFRIDKSYDAMMFVIYFVIALVMGQITSRLREREQAIKKQDDRLNILYQLTRIVALIHDPKEAIDSALRKLEEILQVQGTLFLVDNMDQIDFEKPRGSLLPLSTKEKSVASWVFQQQQPAGKSTETLPEAENFYLPLVSMNKTLGIFAVRSLDKKIWNLDQKSLLESFTSLLTVILEKEMLLKMTEESKIKIESEKLQAALLDSVSHELKTPLTIIAGSAEHLSKNKLSAEAFEKLISEIRTASQRLLQTVNGLLDMTRLDSGQLKLHLEWQDMRDIVNEVIRNLSQRAVNIKITAKYADSLPLVKIDATIIRQVLTNLLSNAINYSPENSEIKISVQIDGKFLLIRISDQGPGIAEDELDKVFEKFYRGKSSRPGGLGLGLSIAKRLIQVHSGNIEVNNIQQGGGGCCFTVLLAPEFFNADQKEIAL